MLKTSKLKQPVYGVKLSLLEQKLQHKFLFCLQMSISEQMFG